MQKNYTLIYINMHFRRNVSNTLTMISQQHN